MTATLLLGEPPKVTHQPWAHCYEVSWAVNGEGYPECFLSTRTAPIVDRKNYSQWSHVDEVDAFRLRVAVGNEVPNMAVLEVLPADEWGITWLSWTWWEVTL